MLIAQDGRWVFIDLPPGHLGLDTGCWSLSCPPLQDERDQLNEYRGHLSGLARRAKAIVQLKPRNPAHPVRGRVPLLAVCDYKQVEVRAELTHAGLWLGRACTLGCGGGWVWLHCDGSVCPR